MDNLVIQAYNQATSKDFLTITETLERMLRKRYAANDPRFSITPGQVRRILDQNRLLFRIERPVKSQSIPGGI